MFSEGGYFSFDGNSKSFDMPQGDYKIILISDLKDQYHAENITENLKTKDFL